MKQAKTRTIFIVAFIITILFYLIVPKNLYQDELNFITASAKCDIEGIKNGINKGLQNYMVESNDYQWSIAMVTYSNGCKDGTNLLIDAKNANISYVSSDGMSLLLLSILNNDWDTFDKLMDKKVNINTTGKYGTPLEFAQHLRSKSRLYKIMDRYDYMIFELKRAGKNNS